MQAYWTLTRRELAGFFVSFTGYLIIASAVFLMGLSFVILLYRLQDETTTLPVTQLFFSTPFFWLILLLGVPVITMRLFALEKYSGTFETLMTTPVSDLQVVLAKFTAAAVFYMFMWLPLLVYILILHHYTNHQEAIDWGLIGSAFLGVALLGSLFMSLGCLASALTRSQIVAAMISFTLGFTFFLLSFLPGYIPMTAHWQAQVFSHFALIDQMEDFARGLVDTRHIVFYLSMTLLSLFLTLRVVESRRWK
ncbi:MAG: gliding motility protein GldF [Pedosphaera sp.]|jgi:ABC-2 type transport system permease protein|nr:gliding motility protein GldF [Pedosphaera sp.]